MIASLILIFFFVSDSREDLTPRIIDGSKCSDIPHSFMVAIVLRRNDKTQFLGGGTLVSENWILTVGLHFYTHPWDIDYEAIAGADSLAEYYANVTHLQKSRFIEMHRTKEQIKRMLDIALLKLEKPMRETKRVTFVRLSTPLDIGYEKLEDICSHVTIMGYSVSKTDDEEKKDEEGYGSLECSQMSVLTHKVCKKKYRESLIPYESGCVSGPNEACYGDAGGPVMCNGIQFGVLSYRYSCGEEIPSLFTRVYTYHTFIRSIVKNLAYSNNVPSRFAHPFNAGLKNYLNNYLLNLIFMLYYLI